MTTIIYIMLALLMNVLEFKNLENVTNNNLFYILTIDTLLFSFQLNLSYHLKYSLVFPYH